MAWMSSRKALQPNHKSIGEEETTTISPPRFCVVIHLNILAIDQARNGAWSVFDYEKKELIGYGTYEFPTEKFSYSKAILHIKELIYAVIKTYDIKAVFVEDIQMRVSVSSFKKLAQLQGVLVNLFEENEYLYGYIAPSQWQNFCKARGRNTKEKNSRTIELERSGKKQSKILSIQFVKEQFGIDTDNDNLADAISLGWYVVNVVEILKRDKSVRKRNVKK